jgi:biotin carboxyl carrier protein
MELIVIHGDREEAVHLEQRDDGGYSVRLGDTTYEVDLAHAGRTMSLLLADGRQFEVASRKLARHGHSAYEITSRRGVDRVEVTDPLTRLAEQAAGDAAAVRTVCAYMPGRVVEVLVAEGDEVVKGQGVLVLEAMKMKNEIQSEAEGTVARLYVEEGQNVEGGDPLFEIG